MEQGGGNITFADLAIKHSMMIRRIRSGNAALPEVPMYSQIHPGLPVPPVRPFMSAIRFRPNKGQDANDKVGPRGRDGILLGYVVNPGGSWTGDYYCVDIKDFKRIGHILLYKTRTVEWDPARPTFPIYDAKRRIENRNLEDTILHEDFANAEPMAIVDADSEESEE